MPALKFESEILEIKNLSSDVKQFKFSVPSDFKFIPGQYISLIMEKDGNTIRRPYSIASSPDKLTEGYVELCIKIINNGLLTPTLNQLKEGDKMQILGPLGNFTVSEHSKDKNLVFISNGTGIGPFKSMIHYLLENKCKNKIKLLAGYRNEEGGLYDEEFKKLQEKYKNFKYFSILSQPSNNNEGNQEIGRVQNLVKNHIDKEAHYYLCGLKDMINSVRAILVNNGIEMKNIFSEKYD